jgi:4-hydroxy-2-oxoheptanedioate aldolase
MNLAFREALDADRVPLQAWMWNPSVLFAEVIAKAGFDSVGLDLQHGAIDFDDLYGLIAVLDANGCTPIVRLPANDRGWATRVLDAGATGLICPDVESAAEAADFVAACRYPPLGRRGFGPARPAIGKGSGYGDSRSAYSPAEANEEVMAIVQIESTRGLDEVEAIVAVDGVNGLFPGPMDFSLSAYGELVWDYEDDRLAQPMQTMIDAAHGAGVPVGLPVFTPESISVLLEMGVDWLQIGNDLAWVSKAAQQTVATVGELGSGVGGDANR